MLFVMRYKHLTLQEDLIEARDSERARKVAQAWCDMKNYQMVAVRQAVVATEDIFKDPASAYGEAAPVKPGHGATDRPPEAAKKPASSRKKTLEEIAEEGL